MCVRCPNGTYQDIQVHLDVNITCKSCSGKKLLIILKMSKDVVPKITCRTVEEFDRKVPLLLDVFCKYRLLRLWISEHYHNFYTFIFLKSDLLLLIDAISGSRPNSNQSACGE